jgi:NAD(P)-dependent dehydrogenase (short-subunit alcohol dehydrogenase family)
MSRSAVTPESAPATDSAGTGGATAIGEFAGLVAVVTGGASGIGAAITRRLQAAGAEVAVLDMAPAGAPAGAEPIRCDVSDDASVRSAIDAVIARFGRLDVVINNAGIGAQGSVEDNADDEWHKVFDVNVVGMVRVARAALPHLRKSPSAAIVNTASVAATAGLPQRALYSATKGAVLSLTKAMAADHLREGIRVNAVNPGTADTPWIGRLLDSAADPEAERAALNARQPHGRLVSADEVAGAVAYLASPLSGSTSGIGLAVDGGMQELRLRPAGQ